MYCFDPVLESGELQVWNNSSAREEMIGIVASTNLYSRNEGKLTT